MKNKTFVSIILALSVFFNIFFVLLNCGAFKKDIKVSYIDTKEKAFAVAALACGYDKSDFTESEIEQAVEYDGEKSQWHISFAESSVTADKTTELIIDAKDGRIYFPGKALGGE